MALLRSTLNGGVAEIGDEFAPALIESGNWVDADDAAAPVKRAPRTRKVAPAAPEE